MSAGGADREVRRSQRVGNMWVSGGNNDAQESNSHEGN